MCVENSECEVAFAEAEPREIRRSANQSLSIPTSGESQVAEHGGPIGGRYNGFATNLGEQLIAPAAAEAQPCAAISFLPATLTIPPPASGKALAITGLFGRIDEIIVV
jgi:hypothetical protein